jgi:hypothetical protein
MSRSATPRTAVEPPPPDLFHASAAGAAVAKPELPQTCCGKYLYMCPIIAVFICLVIAIGVNLAIYEGEPLPFIHLPTYTFNTTGAPTTAAPTTKVATPPPTTTLLPPA